MRKFPFYITIAYILTACSLSSKTEITLPYFNDFKTKNGWSLDAGAIFDPGVSADQGSGSIKLAKAGDNWVLCDRIVSDFKLPVKSGHSYTLSFKSKTETFPPPVMEVYGQMLGDGGKIDNSHGTLCTNSQKGVWEENYVVINIPENDMIKYFKPKILLAPKRSISAPVWIDDIRFEEGIKLPQRSAKKSFEGRITRIDTLGNIEIKKDGKFVPFFPIGIYADQKRSDWSIYKKMGFNINMWASDASAIQKSKDNGLYAMMQMVQYIIPVGEDWIPQDSRKKKEHLKKTLHRIKEKGLFENMLFYYIDNEFYHLKPIFREIIQIVKDEDHHAHPIYMLNGAYGLARMYNNYTDVTGTYAAKDRYETPIVENLEVLDKTPGQKQPVIFAQINRGVGENFRAIVYAAIAKGAKGVGFWRDGGSAGSIEKRPVAKQLPQIATEIEKLMPLIRTPHDTKWQVKSNNDKLIIGTRTLDSMGYMIISNPTRKVIEATFSIRRLSYTPVSAEDYFSHQKVADIKNNVFKFSLEPANAVVLKLVK